VQPLVVADPAADGSQRQPEVAATLERAEHLDVFVLSVEAWKPPASAVYDSEGGQRALADCGLVG